MASETARPGTPRDGDMDTPWRMTGDWWDLCNCAIGCPCVFGSDPTLGYCEGVLTWLIHGGHFGDVDLGSGLAAALVIHWEGKVLEKNREFGFLIDERADADQRVALETIFLGRAGRAFAAWRDLTIQVGGIEFVRMEVSKTDEEWRVEVRGMIEGLGGPYRNLMVPDDGTCRMYNAPRPEVVPGHITWCQAARNVVTGIFGRNWDWSERSAKHIAFDLTGPQAFSWKKPLAKA